MDMFEKYEKMIKKGNTIKVLYDYFSYHYEYKNDFAMNNAKELMDHLGIYFTNIDGTINKNSVWDYIASGTDTILFFFKNEEDFIYFKLKYC